jgi:hypothetical protein
VSEVNIQMVREYFEIVGFHVAAPWQQGTAAARGADPAPLLFAENPRPEPGEILSNPLAPAEIPRLSRAVIEVRAWHHDRFYPSALEANANIGQMRSEELRLGAEAVFGAAEYATIFVLSELPRAAAPRARALSLLQDRGAQYVLEFSTLLRDLIDRLDPHVNYAPSVTLQTLRLAKRYHLLRRQQLEFDFPGPLPPSSEVDVTFVSNEPQEEEA